MVGSTRNSGFQTLSLNLPDKIAADLQNRARLSRRAVEAVAVKLLGKALADQRSYDAWKVKAVKRGLADIKAGRTVPHAEVVATLERARAGRARKKPLEWTRRAARDVISIEAYLEQFNPAAAESVVNTVLNSAVSIASHPEIGRPGKLPRTRELVVSKFPYVIVNRVHAKRVLIARVLHQARQQP